MAQVGARSRRVPLRAALAWVVTQDEDFVDWVLNNPDLDRPDVLVGALFMAMKEARCFVEQQIASDMPGDIPYDQEARAAGYRGRFQSLISDFEQARVERTPLKFRNQKGAKLGTYHPRFGLPLEEYLRSRIDRAFAELWPRIVEFEGAGVLVDGPHEKPAGPIRPQSVTETATLGLRGDVLQAPGSRVAWRSITVSWTKLIALQREQKALAPQRKGGRKPLFEADEKGHLRKEVFRILDDYGGLEAKHPELKSKERLIEKLQDYIATHQKELGNLREPSRTAIQRYVNEFIAEWEARRPGPARN